MIPMNSIKVSVIIPVYNAKHFLHECINSLLTQSLRECEFIFVNDGSSDSSLEIIEEFARKDARIKIFNQENKGISKARNAGLNIAKGEYVGFLDNDDYVKHDMFETLYVNAKNLDLDVVISKTILGRDGKYIVKENGFQTDIVYDQNFSSTEIIKNLLRVEDLFAVWNKLYKRDFIIVNKIHFPKNRDIEEDNMFNIQAFNAANKVLFLEYSGYYYREVVTSKSRLTLENDYFAKALEKYNFDYKKEYNLTISDDEFEKLKAIRFIQRVFYLLYKCSVSNASFKLVFIYIKNMVFNTKVLELATKYQEEVISDKGWYEKAVLKIIIKQSSFLLIVLIFALKVGYHPFLSEFLRKINTSSKSVANAPENI